MLFFSKKTKGEKRADRKRKEEIAGLLASNSALNAISPKQGYYFYGDYFKIDNEYATIFTYFHKAGADSALPAFWGTMLFPGDLSNTSNDISTHVIINLQNYSQKWFDDHLKSLGKTLELVNASANSSNDIGNQSLNQFKQNSGYRIGEDHANGDSYMDVSFKLLVKAPSLKALDNAVDQIRDNYKEAFNRLNIEPYDGMQYIDYSNIFKPSTDQIGKNYGFTSTEIAGAYNLVTQGLNDIAGWFVGVMIGDINNSALLWDMDDFERTAIVAADVPAKTVNLTPSFPPNTRGGAMWGKFLAQQALLHNHRVVHIVLDGSDLKNIGMPLPGITTTISMNHGAVNPFEMFGRFDDEIGIFNANIQKLALMIKTLSPSTSDVDLGKYFQDLVTNFFISQGMWVQNAPLHREELRIVGGPHRSYPRLQDFNVYLSEYTERMIKQGNQRAANSYEQLQSAFHRMASNGDLFNQYTSDLIDQTREDASRQVIYDFSSLMDRGPQIAMAQLLNVINYAVGNLEKGDILMLHGVENITGSMDSEDSSSVKFFINTLIDTLLNHDVRTVFIYDSIHKMLDDTEFNRFASSNWILTSYMDNALVDKYEKLVHTDIPNVLKEQVTKKDSTHYFIHRDVQNIIFSANPKLGTSEKGFLKN